MSKYLDITTRTEIYNKYVKQVVELHKNCMAEYGINLLDNDTISGLCVDAVIIKYDPEYSINFARNKEDAKSGNTLIEQKVCRVKKKKRSPQYPPGYFQFHAMGNIESERYIFATRDYCALNILRIYDITNIENRLKIQEHLFAQRLAWEEKNKKLGYTQSRDVILLPESLLIDALVAKTTEIIDNCEIIKA